MSEETTQGGTAPSTGPSYTTRVPTAIVTSRSRLRQNPRTGQPQPTVELEWSCFPGTDHGLQQVHEFLLIQRATQVQLTDQEIDALRTPATTNSEWVTKTEELIHAKLYGDIKTLLRAGLMTESISLSFAGKTMSTNECWVKSPLQAISDSE